MSVRLINVADVKVGMIVLERHGRGRVIKSHPAYGERGWFYEYLYVEGPHRKTTGSCKGILDNTVWIEESD